VICQNEAHVARYNLEKTAKNDLLVKKIVLTSLNEICVM